MKAHEKLPHQNLHIPIHSRHTEWSRTHLAFCSSMVPLHFQFGNSKEEQMLFIGQYVTCSGFLFNREPKWLYQWKESLNQVSSLNKFNQGPRRKAVRDEKYLPFPSFSAFRNHTHSPKFCSNAFFGKAYLISQLKKSIPSNTVSYQANGNQIYIRAWSFLLHDHGLQVY